MARLGSAGRVCGSPAGLATHKTIGVRGKNKRPGSGELIHAEALERLLPATIRASLQPQQIADAADYCTGSSACATFSAADFHDGATLLNMETYEYANDLSPEKV